jgi:uncharacterized protein (TIGR02145 family)
MKKFNAIIFCLLTIALLSSCDSNKKLEQADAENAIKEFVQTNSFGGGGSWGQQGSFDVNSISSIEPIIQFNEAEASSVAHFNYQDAFSDGNMNLKFNFKRDIDKKWVLTSVEAISGVGSQGMSDRLQKWQNINVMVVKSNNGDNLTKKIKHLFKNEIIDIDGNVYTQVKIGEQVWMVENLKTTKFNDGTNIPNVTSGQEWIDLKTSGYCWYDNDIKNKNTYGALYNWYAANSDKIAPKGWHVPSDAEIKTLIDFLGGNQVAGGKLREAGSDHWNSPNKGATNESGFNFLPGGTRYNYRVKGGTADGTFTDIAERGTLWSSTDGDSTFEGTAPFLAVNYDGTWIENNYEKKVRGFSIRCIKD